VSTTAASATSASRPLLPRRGTTTVHVPPVVRAAFAALGFVAPGAAAALFERVFFTPPLPRRSSGEPILASARRVAVSLEGRPVAAWQWGAGPAILLVHGWGGQAAQLSAVVAPLLAAGYSVVGFDGPGHGRSGRMKSSVVQLARAIRAVSDEVGGVTGVVAHSLGAAATALAMRDGLDPRRVVFLAPVADPISWIPAAAASFGLGPRVMARVQARTEKRLRFQWDGIRVPELAAHFDAALLVIHDRDDPDVPVRNGVEITEGWAGSQLTVTTGLGHNRLLRHPDVVSRTVAFLATTSTAGQ